MQEFENEPHAKGNHGGKLGPYHLAKQCKALTRAKSTCRGPAMKNGRCRMHGGTSTGPKTLEGLERSKAANLKHGYYSAESRLERELASMICRYYRSEIV